jgi:hypothetical protein
MSILWKALREMKVSVKVRRVVEGVYKNAIGRVRLNGKESGQFQMQR